jgi:hypothetical protein
MQPALAFASGDASTVAQHTRRSTAFVSARVSDRSEAVGAGVIIAVSPNVIVLTARHLAARKNLALRTYSGEQLRIVAEYEVADRDLALIVATGACTGCEAAETADAITVGEAIHVWGNPQGKRYVLSAGTIADLRPKIPGFETNGRFALACETCDVGDSGGGVFDDRGRLLGIITEGWDGLNAGSKRVIAEPANHALAHVPLEYIARTDAPPAGAAPPKPASSAATTRNRGRFRLARTCGDAEAVSKQISVAVNANILAELPLSQLEVAKEARIAAARAVHECLIPAGGAAPAFTVRTGS